MVVREIREIEEGVKEIGVVGPEVEEGSWEEDNGTVEEGEEEGEKFSIGDTMLARGKTSEKWGKKSLEEEIYEDEDFEKSFGESDFEEEEDVFFGHDSDESEFGEAEGFSYETIGQNGDFYGVGSSNFYGVGDGSGSNFYDSSGQGGSDSVGLYSTNGRARNESPMYNTSNFDGGKKNNMGSVYLVEGGKTKRFSEGGKRKRSELEGFVSRSRKKQGVSMT